MDVLGEEPGPPLGGPTDRRHHAEHDGGGQQHQGHQAAGPGQVPERPATDGAGGDDGRRGHRTNSSAGWVSSGHPATVTTVPSARTSRAGRLRVANQSGAPSPSTIDAVEAVLASTHESAATVTVRQHGWRPEGRSPGRRGGGPGGRRASSAACRHRRWPGHRTCTDTAVGASESPHTSDTPTRNPSGGAPRTDRSPPSETSTPQPSRDATAAAARSAAQALAVAPRSSSVPGARVTVPRDAVEVDRAPARHGGRVGKRSLDAACHLGDVPVVAEPAQCGTDGRVDGVRRSPRPPRRRWTAPPSARGTRGPAVPSAASRWSRLISESSRNRLATASTRSSSWSRMREAATTDPGRSPRSPRWSTTGCCGGRPAGTARSAMGVGPLNWSRSRPGPGGTRAPARWRGARCRIPTGRRPRRRSPRSPTAHRGRGGGWRCPRRIAPEVAAVDAPAERRRRARGAGVSGERLAQVDTGRRHGRHRSEGDPLGDGAGALESGVTLEPGGAGRIGATGWGTGASGCAHGPNVRSEPDIPMKRR